MDSKYFSAILPLIIMLNLLRVSVTMPVEGGIQGNGGKSAVENISTVASNNSLVNPVSGIDWSKFGRPSAMGSFQPTDMVKVMTGRVTHGVNDKPESYWFNKTITAGTKILRKFEQWKQRYPNTLGVPLGLVLRFF